MALAKKIVWGGRVWQFHIVTLFTFDATEVLPTYFHAPVYKSEYATVHYSIPANKVHVQHTNRNSIIR